MPSNNFGWNNAPAADFSGIPTLYNTAGDYYEAFGDWLNQSKKDKAGKIAGDILAEKLNMEQAMAKAQGGLVPADMEHLMSVLGSQADAKQKMAQAGYADIGVDKRRAEINKIEQEQKAAQRQSQVDTLSATMEASLAGSSPEQAFAIIQEFTSQNPSPLELEALTSTPTYKSLTEKQQNLIFSVAEEQEKQRIKNQAEAQLMSDLATGRGPSEGGIAPIVDASEMTQEGFDAIWRSKGSPPVVTTGADGRAKFALPGTIKTMSDDREVMAYLISTGTFNKLGWDSTVERDMIFFEKEMPGNWEKDKKDWSDADKALMSTFRNLGLFADPKLMDQWINKGLEKHNLLGKDKLSDEDKMDLKYALDNNFKAAMGSLGGSDQIFTRSE